VRRKPLTRTCRAGITEPEIDYAKLIYQVDSQLDDLSFRSELFGYLSHDAVKTMKLTWRLNYLDLGLFVILSRKNSYLCASGIGGIVELRCQRLPKDPAGGAPSPELAAAQLQNTIT
jgi:hypothetical protein